MPASHHTQSNTHAHAGRAAIRPDWWPWAHSMITASGVASPPPARDTFTARVTLMDWDSHIEEVRHESP
jgi:hypothetical protein